MILTAGLMQSALTKFGIRWTLVFCIFNIFLTAEGERMVVTAGSSVKLHCNGESIQNLTQLTWKRDQVNMYSYSSTGGLYMHQKVLAPNLNMSTSESDLYALNVNKVQKSHAGNYSCETTTLKGVFKQEWELVLEEQEMYGRWTGLIPVVAAVPCGCFLLILFTCLITRIICRKHKNKRRRNLPRKQSETIYENCLESQRSNRGQVYLEKPSESRI